MQDNKVLLNLGSRPHQPACMMPLNAQLAGHRVTFATLITDWRKGGVQNVGQCLDEKKKEGTVAVLITRQLPSQSSSRRGNKDKHVNADLASWNAR